MDFVQMFIYHIINSQVSSEKKKAARKHSDDLDH
jgi:hypothetical protein